MPHVTTIQFYRGAAAGIPTLADGEPGWTTDMHQLYVGQGGVNYLVSGSGTGTVTSVDASGGTTGLSFSGGPITTSGTLTLSGTLGVGNGGTGQTSYTDGQLLIGNSTGNTLTKATLTAGSGISITNGGGSITIAATGGGGTVTTVSVATANGFAGSVANATTTPAITISTTVTGLLKGDGTSVSAAVAGTDYLTGNQTITLSGDVSGSGTTAITTTIGNDKVTTATILNANVTLAKIANASANSKLLGSGSAGSGASYSEITLGSGLSMSGTTLSATGSGGDVVGPAIAGDNVVCRFDGTTGKLIQTSTAVITDAGKLQLTATNDSNIEAVMSDAVTTTASNIATYDHFTSGTPAAGYGSAERWRLASATISSRDAYVRNVTWTNATDATRKARVSHNVYDTAAREYMRGEASGTAPMIGFLGASASAALASPDLGTLATTFGLATGTPTFAAANLTGTVTLAKGGTGADLSATGGANQFVRQSSAGGAFTVSALAAADLPALNGFTDADPVFADVVPIYDTSASANRDTTLDKLLGLARLHPGGRLTGTSGSPVSNSTAPATIYFTPYLDDMICLWDGTRWVWVTFAETSLALGTVVPGAAYDVFGYLSGGALALEKLLWQNGTATMTIATPCVVTYNSHGFTTGDQVTFTTTGALPTGVSANTRYFVNVVTANAFNLSTTAANLTAGTYVATSGSQSGTHTAYSAKARATAVTIQDGRYCKSGDKTRLLLGSFLAGGTTTTEDRDAYRYLSNVYNRVPRRVYLCPGYSDDNATTSYSVTSTVWTEANGFSRVEVFFTLTGNLLINSSWNVTIGSNPGRLALGIDTVKDPDTMMALTALTSFPGVGLSFGKDLTAGLHYSAMLVQVGGGTTTVNADLGRAGGSSVDAAATFQVGSILN